ncbi:hypothetical protein Gpo141_00009356 [Globisporangium polare]
MKRAIQHPSAARAARSIASESTAMRRSADASLADKFNLAALNGGKSPFQVSSNSLLKPSAADAISKTEKEVKDVYSLEYLLGGDAKKSARKSATEKKMNPFDVASSKLM